MGKQNKNETFQISRREILKKAYKAPLLVCLGASSLPLNAGVSDLQPPPPPSGTSVGTSNRSSFDPFPTL